MDANLIQKQFSVSRREDSKPVNDQTVSVASHSSMEATQRYDSQSPVSAE